MLPYVFQLRLISDRASASDEDRFAAMSLTKHWELVEKNPKLLRGKRVIAAFVMERKLRSRPSTYEVVALATGKGM